MWKTVTVQGFEQTLINLDSVSYLARVKNQTEVRFLGERVIFANEEPSAILASPTINADNGDDDDDDDDDE